MQRDEYFEQYGRTKKALKFASHLAQYGITFNTAANLSDAEWQDVASRLGSHVPSDKTKELTIHLLRAMEELGVKV